jgi:diacylglycerol kinase (ATP)
MVFLEQDPPAARSMRPVRAKLIFNPSAGDVEESPYQLSEIITLLQTWRIIPEVMIVTPKTRIAPAVSSAIRHGIKLIIVSGGDGTIETVIEPMVGTTATLGIIPTGTRNNLALSLGIPPSIPDAIELIRRGHRIRIDVGHARCGRNVRWFLETSSVGLASALYSSADEIQHGNLARIADFLSTLVTSQPAEMNLIIDGEEKIKTQGHLAFVANMPYFGANFHVSQDVSFQDGYLDLFVFSDLTKLELMTYAVQVLTGVVEDERILHYKIKKVVMETVPKMLTMADGVALGEGVLTTTVHPESLNIMSGLKPIVEKAAEAKPDTEAMIP